MLALKRDFDLTYLYITHDLATAKFFCDRIAILYLGRVVEIGPSDAIYADPKHPYTQALLRAIPEPDPLRSVPRDLPRGEVPDAAQPPLGCMFHPRCSRAFEVCGWESRDLRALLETRWARMSPERYEAEQALFADLSPLDESSTRVRLKARKGAAGGDLLSVLESARDDDPAEPFWSGVRRLTAGDDYVEVEWHEPVDPRLLETGGVQVACHLHDPEALRQAEEIRVAS
jgi:oligopeptide/dipeptide ABC transporter ATP-binding protein